MHDQKISGFLCENSESRKPPPPPTPTISDAKRLTKQYRMKACIVIGFPGNGSGRFSLSSYGETRALCGRAKEVVDQIHDMIADGAILVPDELA